MQALRLPAVHAAAARRGAASARAAAPRCASSAPRSLAQQRSRVSAAQPPRPRRALRVRASSTIDVSPVEVTDVTANRVVVVGGCDFVAATNRLCNCRNNH